MVRKKKIASKGSSFDSFLKEHGIYNEVTMAAIKKAGKYAAPAVSVTFFQRNIKALAEYIKEGNSLLITNRSQPLFKVSPYKK